MCTLYIALYFGRAQLSCFSRIRKDLPNFCLETNLLLHLPDLWPRESVL